MSRADDLIGRLQSRIVELEQRRGGVVPEWLRDDESLAERLRVAGWEAVHDAQWVGLEVLRNDILQARLSPTGESVAQ